MAKKRKRSPSRSRSGASPARRTTASSPKRTTVSPPPRARGSRRLPLILLGGALVLGGYYLWQLHQARRPAPAPTFLSPAPRLAARPLPGLQTGPSPWGTAASDLRARLEAIGLPVLSAEATVVHIHEHLDLFVDGKRITVPAGVGINSAAGYLSPLHTHDDSGLIHVESPTRRPYTLGQFFDVWGVRFTKSCLGGYCDQGDRRLRVFVGGKLIRGDPRLLELALHQEIVVTYGTRSQLPHPVPSSYSFPIGA